MFESIFRSFGLRENPFTVSPNPRFLYTTPGVEEALAHFLYGIATRRGFVLLTGEPGTGKTLLVQHLLNSLREQRVPTAYIFNSHVDAAHLVQFLVQDFGIECDTRNKTEALRALESWLLKQYASGIAPVLILDEAQGLSDDALEEVRLLLNLEAPGEKLLQVVLIGQPELDERLRKPALRQLRQRITLHCRTSPLTLAQTIEYVQSRLKHAGAGEGEIFSPEALLAIFTYSQGVPRVVNLLCEHALLNCYAQHLQNVSVAVITDIAKEFELAPLNASHPLPSIDYLMPKLTVMEQPNRTLAAAPAFLAANQVQKPAEQPVALAASASNGIAARSVVTVPVPAKVVSQQSLQVAPAANISASRIPQPQAAGKVAPAPLAVANRRTPEKTIQKVSNSSDANKQSLEKKILRADAAMERGWLRFQAAVTHGSSYVIAKCNLKSLSDWLNRPAFPKKSANPQTRHVQSARQTS